MPEVRIGAIEAPSTSERGSTGESNITNDPRNWLRLAINSMRRNGSILNIAPLDMSCAFSVADARQGDMPIVYCSPEFERLTQYKCDEIKGVNHRFMQDPRGRQRAGVRRQHTNSAIVLRMMQGLSLGEEVQVSLQNFARNTRAWNNLVTMIPIVLSRAPRMDFVVGLQLDMGENPQRVLQYPDGSCKVDYRAVQDVPRVMNMLPDNAGTMPPEIDQILASAHSARLWSRYLIRQLDDTIFFLSADGEIIGCSPSVVRLLGYTPKSLVGKHISLLVHPSDFALMLKDFASTDDKQPVSLLSRVRHIDGQYRWIEFAGRACKVGSGNEPKQIILSARLRLLLTSIDDGIDVGPNEFWSRLSTDGMLLFTTAAATKLLGVPRAQLLGSHFSDHIGEWDRETFERKISAAQLGCAGGFQHVCIQTYPDHGKQIGCVSDIFPCAQVYVAPQFLMMRTRVVAPDTTSAITLSDSSRESSKLSTPEGEPDLEFAMAISLEPTPLSELVAALDVTRVTTWQAELRKSRQVNRRLRQALKTARAQQRLAAIEPKSP